FSRADRRLRLLAVAVNTALALRPRFVDLWTTRHTGPADTVARVRWLSPEDGEKAQDPLVEYLLPPEGLPPRGMRFHVRERFGTAVVREWLSAEPAETRLLRER